MMSLVTDLRDARDLIDAPEKWTKGIDRDGCAMCALWAVSAVTNPKGAVYAPRWDEAKEALERAAPRDFKQYLCPVVAFNDADATTHADVMALFDRAIASAQRRAA